MDCSNLLLLTAPLDFANRDGVTFAKLDRRALFRRGEDSGALRQHAGRDDRLRGQALKPVENYIANYCKLWDNLDDPAGG